MLNTIGITTALLSTILTATIATNSPEKTTCNAGSYFAGQNAYVTCKFSVDIKADRYALNVVKYPLNSTSSGLESEVLNCDWNMETLDCFEANGVQVTDVLRDTLTFKILNASQRFTGVYLCHILPSDGICAMPCNLLIEENPRDPSQTTTPDYKETTCTRDTHQWITNAVYIVLPLTITLVVVIAVLCIWKSRSPATGCSFCQPLRLTSKASVPMLRPENSSIFDAATGGSQDFADMINPGSQPYIPNARGAAEGQMPVELANATFRSSQSSSSDVSSDGGGTITTSSTDVHSVDNESPKPKDRRNPSPVFDNL